MSASPDPPQPRPNGYLEAATYGFSDAETLPTPASPFSPRPSEPRLDAASTRRFADVYRRLVAEIEKAFVGQRELVVGALVALFSGGHVLVESVPGLGKTLFAQALGRAIGCRFSRVQFTPDLTSSDVVGALVFNAKTQEFTFRPGPVFTQILLADEINRSPAKTHAALLEATQEGAATVDGRTYPLPTPFFTIATQNPIESEGAYRLPEAQLDRFMFKLVADYPSAAEERKILVEHGKNVSMKAKLDAIEPVLTAEEVSELVALVDGVYVAPQLYDYVVQIVRATRSFPRLALGASTRAGLALVQGARVLAAFAGRDYATPDDVVPLVLPTLRHRVVLTPEAEIEGRRIDDVLTALIRSIEPPRL